MTATDAPLTARQTVGPSHGVSPGDAVVAQVPRDVRQITELVQETWAALLGVASVGPDDDFFELGGHSLMAASAVALLGERLGIDLPAYALFTAPTAAEMTELIAELGREREDGPIEGVTPFHPAWVLPLQPEGAGRPVFVFPAGHNEINALAVEAGVAIRVGRDRPFWGFGRDDPGLDQARAGGIPAMAAAYIAQMRAIQGPGPYLLYANCAGGPYAWETARQLLDSGDEIAGILYYEVPLSPNFASPCQVSLQRRYRAPCPHPVPTGHNRCQSISRC